MKIRFKWLCLIKAVFLMVLAPALTGCMTVVAIEPIEPSTFDVNLKPEMTVRVERQPGFIEGFQCFEPYFWVATIGVIPIHCIGTYQATASNAIGEEQELGTYRVTSVKGWIAYLMAPFPNWSLETGHDTPAFIEGLLKKKYEAQAALRAKPTGD